MGTLLTVLRWAVRKLAAASLIVVLGLSACGLWLFLQDNVSLETWRQEAARAIGGERTKARMALDDVTQRLSRTAAALVAEEARDKQAERVIARLKELESTWDRLVGNPEQQKANAEQMERMTALREQIQARRVQLQDEQVRATWERDGLELALGRIEVRWREMQAERSMVMHYFERTWNHPVGAGNLRLAAKWWLLVALGMYLLGPTLWKTGLFYMVAPFIVRSRPVRLQPDAAVLPEVSASQVDNLLALLGRLLRQPGGGGDRPEPWRETLGEGAIPAGLGRGSAAPDAKRARLADTPDLPGDRAGRVDRNEPWRRCR